MHSFQKIDSVLIAPPSILVSSLFVNSDKIKRSIIINSIIARLQNIPVELILKSDFDDLLF